MPLNKTAQLLLAIFVVTSIIIFYVFSKEAKDWFVGYWGVIGSNASVLGIFYTIVALNQLKAESEIVVTTTSEVKQKLSNFHGIAELAKAIKLIQEIQGYARDHKYDVGIIRLQELKITISQLNIISSDVAEIPDTTDTLFTLNKLISSMEKEINSNRKNLRIVTVNQNLEAISDMLVLVQTSIKQRN